MRLPNTQEDSSEEELVAVKPASNFQADPESPPKENSEPKKNSYIDKLNFVDNAPLSQLQQMQDESSDEEVGHRGLFGKEFKDDDLEKILKK